MTGKGKTWRKWTLGTGFLVLLAAAPRCNKTSLVNAARIGVTSTYEYGPLDVRKTIDSSILAAPVSYGTTSGVKGDPYVSVGAGVRPIYIFSGANLISNKNSSFTSDALYTMFLYNDSASTAVRLFVKQDYLIVRLDSFSYVRILNFSPGASSFYQFKMVNRRGDSLVTSFLNYVGNSQNSNLYPFQLVPVGRYGITVFRDIARTSSLVLADTLEIDSSRSVTAYIQGYFDSTGDKKMRLRTITHN